MSDTEQTPTNLPLFDFDAFPADTLFHDRRTGTDRRSRKGAQTREAKAPSERRSRKERRGRVDPTTFEKQYTPDELEFMGAMQEYKMRTGKSFPSYGEVLDVARRLGYAQTGPRRPIAALADMGETPEEGGSDDD
jgi:hypothetical protein